MGSFLQIHEGKIHPCGYIMAQYYNVEKEQCRIKYVLCIYVLNIHIILSIIYKGR